VATTAKCFVRVERTTSPAHLTSRRVCETPLILLLVSLFISGSGTHGIGASGHVASFSYNETLEMSAKHASFTKSAASGWNVTTNESSYSWVLPVKVSTTIDVTAMFASTTIVMAASEPQATSDWRIYRTNAASNNLDVTSTTSPDQAGITHTNVVPNTLDGFSVTSSDSISITSDRASGSAQPYKSSCIASLYIPTTASGTTAHTAGLTVYIGYFGFCAQVTGSQLIFGLDPTGTLKAGGFSDPCGLLVFAEKRRSDFLSHTAASTT
jgi:hypothetical protein